MARTSHPIMHSAFRQLFLSSLLLPAALAGCKTHDRLIYSTRPVKNLRVPDRSASAPVSADPAAPASAASGTTSAPSATGAPSGAR